VTSRKRNLAILGLVVLLLGAAAVIIATKPTRLGLDLRGGTELVYEGRPTPKVPEVTPQALDDAIETMRKRTDALGVSEPEIQRAGSNQISIGLPDVQNAERAKEQVGTTAQLQFYDWEPNVLGERGPGAPYGGGKALFRAVEVASKERPRAEATDLGPDPPPGISREEADRRNDSAKERFYLFGPDQRPIGPDRKPVQNADYQPSGSCKELLADYEKAPGSREYAKGTECRDQLEALGGGGPPSGSTVIKVPQGIIVVQDEKREGEPQNAPPRYFVLEDDSELSGSDIENPEQNFDQRTNEPIVTMEFTDTGRKAFAAATKREAERGSRQILPPGTPREQAFQRFAITLDDRIVSLATIDFVENPEGIDGRTGAQIEGIRTSPRTCASAPCRSRSS
jgi:SecD/SecF fusion protein